MLNKDMLIEIAKEAEQENKKVCVIKDNDVIKFFAFSGSLMTFLRENNYWFKNLITVLPPKFILLPNNRHNTIIYMGDWNTSINDFIEYFNRDYKNYIIEV